MQLTQQTEFEFHISTILLLKTNVLSQVPATGTIATRDRMPAVACDWLD